MKAKSDTMAASNVSSDSVTGMRNLKLPLGLRSKQIEKTIEYSWSPDIFPGVAVRVVFTLLSRAARLFSADLGDK